MTVFYVIFVIQLAFLWDLRVQLRNLKEGSEAIAQRQDRDHKFIAQRLLRNIARIASLEERLMTKSFHKSEEEIKT